MSEWGLITRNFYKICWKKSPFWPRTSSWVRGRWHMSHSNLSSILSRTAGQKEWTVVGFWARRRWREEPCFRLTADSPGSTLRLTISELGSGWPTLFPRVRPMRPLAPLEKLANCEEVTWVLQGVTETWPGALALGTRGPAISVTCPACSLCPVLRPLHLICQFLLWRSHCLCLSPKVYCLGQNSELKIKVLH